MGVNERHASHRLLKGFRATDPSVNMLAERVAEALVSVAGVEVVIPGPTPEKAGTPFVVTHGLGETPDAVSMVDNGDFGGICFARDEEDKSQWTATHVVLRCTVNRETNLTVRLTRRPA